MSSAARVILWGMLLVVAAIAAYAFVDWVEVLGRFPHYERPLGRAVKAALDLSWHWAFAVPVLLFLAAVYRLARASTGRGLIAWKLFAYFTLWAIGSLAFFVGLFLAYAPDLGEGGTELLVPALLGCLGYLLIGLGFLASVLRKPS